MKEKIRKLLCWLEFHDFEELVGISVLHEFLDGSSRRTDYKRFRCKRKDCGAIRYAKNNQGRG